MSAWLIFACIWLLVNASGSAAQGGSSAKSRIDFLQPPNHFQKQMQAFLRNCAAGKVAGTELVITGIDASQTQAVHLSFELTDDVERKKCDLQIRARGEGLGKIEAYPLDNLEGPPRKKAKGFWNSLKEIFKPKEHPSSPYIDISVYTGPNAHWELNSFYPEGIVSGRFFKSFIAQGIDVHSSLLGKQLKLVLTDHSSIREQYWLTKRRGKTYYEDRWNMKYSCFLEESDPMASTYRRSFSQTFLSCFDSSPAPAFADLTFEKVQVADDTGVVYWFPFHPPFVKLFGSWVRSNKAEIEKMRTIGDAIGSWGAYYPSRVDYQEMKPFAISTFLFFFRHHENFNVLSLQVLGLGRCEDMIGIPNKNDPWMDLEAFYRPIKSGPKSLEVRVGVWDLDFSLGNTVQYVSVVAIFIGILICSYSLEKLTTSRKRNDDYRQLEI